MCSIILWHDAMRKAQNTCSKLYALHVILVCHSLSTAGYSVAVTGQWNGVQTDYVTVEGRRAHLIATSDLQVWVCSRGRSGDRVKIQDPVADVCSWQAKPLTDMSTTVTVDVC